MATCVQLMSVRPVGQCLQSLQPQPRPLCVEYAVCMYPRPFVCVYVCVCCVCVCVCVYVCVCCVCVCVCVCVCCVYVLRTLVSLCHSSRLSVFQWRLRTGHRCRGEEVFLCSNDIWGCQRCQQNTCGSNVSHHTIIIVPKTMLYNCSLAGFTVFCSCTIPVPNVQYYSVLQHCHTVQVSTLPSFTLAQDCN